MIRIPFARPSQSLADRDEKSAIFLRQTPRAAAPPSNVMPSNIQGDVGKNQRQQRFLAVAG
jgi:hypothetical protein